MRRHSISALLALAITIAYSGVARADAKADCLSNDNMRRITGCSELIDDPRTNANLRARAYAMRALAYSLRGQYARSVPDYDEAIRLSPGFAVAWNNRAWSLFKSGQPVRALPDVQKSLGLSPLSAHSYDTRAHIYQVTGKPKMALSDYNMAIRLGGKRMTRLYQCGLQEQGLYLGLLDGLNSPALQSALTICMTKSKCDPLPENEDCRQATS